MTTSRGEVAGPSSPLGPLGSSAGDVDERASPPGSELADKGREVTPLGPLGSSAGDVDERASPPGSDRNDETVR